MKQVTVWKISSLPALLSLFLWLSGGLYEPLPVSGKGTVGTGSQTPGWSSAPARDMNGPMALGVGIFCSLGILAALRFQESLQEHARTR